MKPRAGLLIGCSILAASCVKDMRYRYFPDQTCGPAPCINLPARVSQPGWELAFVEFKDSGEPWDARQTTEAVNLIQQAKKDNGGAAIVLVYVHGWKNNANDAAPPKEKDVEKFKHALNALAVQFSEDTHGQRLPPLVGIYVAWRGGTLMAEPGKTLSYWARRAVGRRVGRKGLFASMNRIIDAAKPQGETRTKLILVGHSFGARVLENAVDGLDERNNAPGRLLAWQKALPPQTSAGTPQPPADLVVYINAATQSSISGKTIERLRDKGTVFYGPGVDPDGCKDDPYGDRRPECRPIPLYVAVSSTGDIATRFVLPIANSIIPPAPLPLRLRSAAFTSRLRSHTVQEVACPAMTPYRCGPSGDREFCFEATRDEQRTCYEVRRKPNASNRTPFWAMTVDPRVIKDHGDIWTPNVMDLFAAVLIRTRAADVRATRVMTTVK
jgi:hypothetical protein